MRDTCGLPAAGASKRANSMTTRNNCKRVSKQIVGRVQLCFTHNYRLEQGTDSDQHALVAINHGQVLGEIQSGRVQASSTQHHIGLGDDQALRDDISECA